ncbi:hypothetical protein FQA39_LY14299 [Lamprigera yunnana]|nr:hypothetical protein FQA39_LY14299 [Lamprigera yunnana]
MLLVLVFEKDNNITYLYIMTLDKIPEENISLKECFVNIAAQKLKEHLPEHSNEEEAGPSNLSSHLQKQYESEEEYNDPFSSDDSIKDKKFTAASAKTSDFHGSSLSKSEELDSDSDDTDESVDTNSSLSGNVTPNIAMPCQQLAGHNTIWLELYFISGKLYN